MIKKKFINSVSIDYLILKNLNLLKDLKIHNNNFYYFIKQNTTCNSLIKKKLYFQCVKILSFFKILNFKHKKLYKLFNDNNYIKIKIITSNFLVYVRTHKLCFIKPIINFFKTILNNNKIKLIFKNLKILILNS